MSLSLGDIAKNKKTESKPSVEVKKEFSFKSKSSNEVPKQEKAKIKMDVQPKVDLQKPWEAHRIQPKTKPNRQTKSKSSEQPGLNFNNIEQLFSLKKVEAWVNQIEVSPKIKIPVPSFFTIKSDD